MESSLRSFSGPRIKYTPDDSPYEAIAVDKLTPIIGGEIGGVDLRQPTNRQMDEIHRALAENLVIFFRDQHLTPEQHLDFGRKFGDLHIHPAAPSADGHPELMVIHGDTLFANMYAAYEALSDRMKTYLDGLTARHNGEHYRGQYANYGVKDKESYPYADHPVVRTHPVTGRKALYVNKGFTRYINGIPRDESDGILRYLYDHMANPLFQCRFRWQANSIAFWDNRCVQHHAMWDYWPHTRSGHRVTVRGDRPV